MPLLLLLTLLAVADFVVLFTVGAKIGLLATLLWIVLSAAFGIHLIRRESFLTLQRARERLNRGELPSDELLAGASFVLSGLLLVAPGFLSDVAGLLCLLPGSGELLRRWFRRPAPAGTYSSSRHSGSADAGWDHAAPGRSSADHQEASRHASHRETDAPIEGDYLGKD
ncbi:FxsA family protein [Salinicola rhizosphaerae]|uniref:Membrane protein FxsA n=1 Tax=Salinicola rhizosphaerae TaxID=1443141 RepID=A0ABQ3E9R2_9GAMM|nr:FxsA family protein [Salinicola rhizosphaerae]GHB27245.1 membrane protein FxsA [Salinicola rhizosphaerae]